MNHVATRTATTATTDPPMESTTPMTPWWAMAHTRVPISHPTASPIAAKATRTMSAMAAWPNGDDASPATCGATTAPTTRPAKSPRYAVSWSAAPRRNPFTAARTTMTMMMRSSRFTAVSWQRDRGRGTSSRARPDAYPSNDVGGPRPAADRLRNRGHHRPYLGPARGLAVFRAEPDEPRHRRAQRARARRHRQHRRPDERGVPPGVQELVRVPGPDQGADAHRHRQSRRSQRRVPALRGARRTAALVGRRAWRARRRRGLERARHQRRSDRAGTLRLDPGAVRGPCRAEGLRPASPPAAHPRDRPRTERRQLR